MQLAARVIAIGVPVVGALPTAKNLYESWKHGIPFSEVSHRLAQYDLWVRNGACRIDYREINAQKGAKVQIGACPTTGDISIKIALANGQAKYEWLAFDRLQKAATASLLGGFIGSAHAEMPQKLAQAPPGQPAGPQVQCQDIAAGKVVRVVTEANKCFRETINPIQGKLEKREEIPCANACPAPKKS